MVKSTFKTHYYKWADGLCKQIAGGPIDLRASGSIAKLCIWYGAKEAYRKIFLDSPGICVPGERQDEKEIREVRCCFYKKPMASPITILSRTAMMEGCKVAKASA